MRKNSFFVLGSLHGYMLKNPQYSLREFIGAIVAFKPDLILTEVRAEHSGAAEGSIDGGIEQSIVYAFGDETNTPVIPVDWFEEPSLEISHPELEQEARALVGEYQKQILEGSFPELQGMKTQDLVRSIYRISEKHGEIGARQRNEKICENIKVALSDIYGKRILIIFGLDHKHFLEDWLSAQEQDISNPESTPEISDSLKAVS
jgi:hypothetical protein